MKMTATRWFGVSAIFVAGCAQEAKKAASEGALNDAAPSAPAQAKGSAVAVAPSAKASDGGFRGGDDDWGVEVPMTEGSAAATASPEMPIPQTAKGDPKPIVMQAFNTPVGPKVDPASVEKTFAQSSSKLTACVTVDTTVNVTLKISPSGKVLDARVPRSMPSEPRMRDCVAQVLKSLTFEKLDGNEPANISMDLALRKTP
jgi:hypothetical protein